MRINEILTESQLQQLDEGPLGALGRGIGKVVGGVAKGVGAIAGGVVGAGTALKKGYQSGKAVVGDDPDPNAGQPGYDGSAPAAGGATAGGATAGGATAGGATAGGAAPAASTPPPSAQDINAQGPTGTAPAKAQTGQAGAALAKTDAVTDKQTAIKAGETVYAQVKANIDKLDKKGKQRILQLLTKSVAAPAPKAPAAAGAAAADPAAPAAADPAAADPAAAGAGAMGQMAKQLAGEKPNTMANAPVSKTNVAKPGNPNAAAPADPAASAAAATKARGGRKAGAGPSMTPDAIRKRASREAAAAKATAGNAAMGGMANQLQQQNASKNNYGNALSEALARRVEMHKQKMFETGLSKGTISVFRK